MKGIADIVAERPELRHVMKRFKPSAFLACGVEIATHPAELPGIRVYGDFLIDRKSGQVKQDFVTYELATGKVAYYSGKTSRAFPAIGRHINELGRRLRGTGHYGVSADGLISNHHYSSDVDPDLPAEPEVRQRISDCLAQVKAALGTL